MVIALSASSRSHSLIRTVHLAADRRPGDGVLDVEQLVRDTEPSLVKFGRTPASKASRIRCQLRAVLAGQHHPVEKVTPVDVLKRAERTGDAECGSPLELVAMPRRGARRANDDRISALNLTSARA